MFCVCTIDYRLPRPTIDYSLVFLHVLHGMHVTLTDRCIQKLSKGEKHSYKVFSPDSVAQFKKVHLPLATIKLSLYLWTRVAYESVACVSPLSSKCTTIRVWLGVAIEQLYRKGRSRAFQHMQENNRAAKQKQK